MSSFWKRGVLALLAVAIFACVAQVLYSFMQAGWKGDPGLIGMNVGLILQLGGLAGGVWVLRRWGSFLIRALIAWSIFGAGMVAVTAYGKTYDPVSVWSIGTILFALLQAASVVWLYRHQKRSE